MNFLENQYFLLALTFLIYFLAKSLQQKFSNKALLNPILISIIALISILSLCKIPYTSYEEASKMLMFWLKPAVVALGVPLYLQLARIRKDFLAILMSQIVACAVGIISVCLIAKGLGASNSVIISLAPKSVTTPIAMEISETLHGIPSLTSVIVISVGILGSVLGFKTLSLVKIKNPYSQGLSMGTASHAVGTARAMEEGELYGAYASLGLVLNGVLTAMLTPYLLNLMGII